MHVHYISKMYCSNSLSIIPYTSLFIPAYVCACLVVSGTLWTVAHQALAFSSYTWKGISVCSSFPHSPFCSLGDGEVYLVSVNVEMENSCWTWPNCPKSSKISYFWIVNDKDNSLQDIVHLHLFLEHLYFIASVTCNHKFLILQCSHFLIMTKYKHRGRKF